MGGQHYLLSAQEKKIDTKIKSLTRNKSLKINATTRRNIDRNLKRIQSLVRSANRDIKQEVSTLSSARQINALPPLFRIFQIVSADPKVTLEEFISSGPKASGTFLIKDAELLKDIDKTLKNSGLANLKTKIAGDKLQFSYQD